MKILKLLFLAGLILLDETIIRAQVKQINLYPLIVYEQKAGLDVSLGDVKETLTIEPELIIYMPLSKARVTSAFGWRKHPITGKMDFHQGIDLVAKDKIVRNIMEGRVIDMGYHKNLGNYVRVDHGKVQSVYGHLSVITARKHQFIEAGQAIGITGSSGRAIGEHLHFAVLYDGVFINPWPFLQTLINTNHN